MRNIVATPAPKPKSKLVQQLAWAYAALLTVMVVGQLFNFENFIPAIQDFNLPGGAGTAALFAGTVVFAEIFALPYLLGMPLSPLMRWVSLAMSLWAPVVWFKLALWDFMSGAIVAAPMFGTKIASMMVPTVVALPLAFAMFVVAVYIARGMWPSRKRSKKR